MSKALFDTIRRLLGRGLTQAEVDQINVSLGSCAKPDAPSEPEKNATPRGISAEGMDLIKRFEGCHKVRSDGLIEAYPDPAPGNKGLPVTVGWGTTRIAGKPIVLGTLHTREQIDEYLEADMERYAADVVKALGNALRATSQQQFDALVSFHYNTGAIGRATLTRKHVSGDYRGAAAEFDKWTRAGGQVLKGLVRRRAAERKLYEEGSR